MQCQTHTVYRNLYTIVKENYEKTGEPFAILEEGFIQDVGNLQGSFDIASSCGLDNRAFFQTAFRRLFSRLPDRNALESWGGRMKEDKEVFQKELLCALLSSQERVLKQPEILNNPYEIEENERLRRFRNMDQKYYNRLHGIYLKMPAWTRRMIRRLVR